MHLIPTAQLADAISKGLYPSADKLGPNYMPRGVTCNIGA
jgi:hypothetical protein